MTTLGTTFAGIYLAMPAKTKEKESGPPINAASKDEEKFIQYASMPERKRLSRARFRDLHSQNRTDQYLQGLPEECGWGRESEGLIRSKRQVVKSSDLHSAVIPRTQRITAHDCVQKIENHYFSVRRSGLLQFICIPDIIGHYQAIPVVITRPIEQTHQQPLRYDCGGLESS